MHLAFFDSTMFIWVIIPLLIFCARIVDVSLDTIRIIYVSRGLKYLAPIFGFFEVLIWLFAIGQIMKNLTNILYYIAYASGFAMGNFVGIILEDRLAMGKVVLRIITQRDAKALVSFLRSEGYGITVLDAETAAGSGKIIFTIIARKHLDAVLNIVGKFNPRAFFTVEDVRIARNGIFPQQTRYLDFLRRGRPAR
jgi:uncharacterized protein YebE (UPF0316 family)